MYCRIKLSREIPKLRISLRPETCKIPMGMLEAELHTYFTIEIKTHGSKLWGQEKAGLRDEPVSYLQVAPL